MKALVIDDSSAARMILKKMLTELGFEVTTAGDGQEGLERLKQMGKPDLLLVDWDMPVMNGYEFIGAVRSSHEYDNTPLMMITAHTEMETVSLALHAGANEYVMKPFTADVIKEKLQLLGIPT